MDKEIITYSAAKTLRLCQKKFYWQHEEKLIPKEDEDSEALAVGNISHLGLGVYVEKDVSAALAAIEEYKETFPAIGDAIHTLEQRCAQARAVVQAVNMKWPKTTQKPAIAERTFTMDIRNPETGAISRSFIYAMKMDAVEDETLEDWKVVSDPEEFIEQSTIGNQTELYFVGLQENGIRATTALFRLIKRPTIKFCGKDKDAAAYEQRCIEWLLDDPKKMMEHEMYVNPARVERAKQWLWDSTKEILENRRTGRWMANELACKTWNRTCPYMKLCMGEAQGNDVEWIKNERFQIAETSHPELGMENGTPKEMTHA